MLKDYFRLDYFGLFDWTISRSFNWGWALSSIYTQFCSVLIVMLTDLLILCIPFSFPSFYLAYQLVVKRFMGTIFNQQVAFMCVISGEAQCWGGCQYDDLCPGLSVPVSMSLVIVQSLPDSLQTLQTAYLASSICGFLKYSDLTWNAFCFSSLNWSVLFRSYHYHYQFIT